MRRRRRGRRLSKKTTCNIFLHVSRRLSNIQGYKQKIDFTLPLILLRSCLAPFFQVLPQAFFAFSRLLLISILVIVTVCEGLCMRLVGRVIDTAF